MLAIIVVAIIAIFSIDPIAQDPAYHNFADQRRILNIANFFNVLSNLPFVIIGIMGIRLVALHKATGGLAELQAMYLTFFVGVFLTGFGSAYYHYQPRQSNPALGSPADDDSLHGLVQRYYRRIYFDSAGMEIICPIADIGHCLSGLLA